MNTSTTQEQPLVCSTCGAVAATPEAARLSWSLAVEAGRIRWTCERCSREHVRSIESKLDPAWW